MILYDCFDCFNFKFVIEREVKFVIMGLFCNKVFGYDKIFVRILKDSLLVIFIIIIRLINSLFELSVFLKVWKIVEVILIFKDRNLDEFFCN